MIGHAVVGPGSELQVTNVTNFRVAALLQMLFASGKATC